MYEHDIEFWCDETLPELYDEGMFDLEETSEDVWDAVAAAMEPLLETLDDREEIADALTEAAREWFRLHHETVLESIQPVPTYRITDLCNKPQTAQHTAEWYNQRRNRLTASEFSQILDGRRGALLRQKLSQDTGDRVGLTSPVGIAQADGEMNATTWGHRFEPVTRRIYELEIAGLDTVNDKLGRFTHQRIKWLSASPDGLVTTGPLQGRLVEIKSPKTRQPGEFVPVEYFVQMQIQMEVCDLDVVDFVEAQFQQRPVDALTTEDEAAYTKAAWKGRIEVRGHLDDPTSWRYVYSEPAEDLEDAMCSLGGEDPLLESSVWWLTGWYPRTVLRNRAWWSSVGWPNAELFWAEVESLRDQHQDTIVHIEDGWIGSNDT
jgi:hypothetical protein